MDAQSLASLILPAHVVAGGLALVFGYLALYAAKGAAVHRKSGTLFVWAMLIMSGSGAVMATLKPNIMNVVAGSVTFYMVLTAMLTVRPRTDARRRLDVAAMLLASSVALIGFGAGVELSTRGRPEAYPMFIFGVVALLGARGDLRMLRAGGLQGPPRIKRHLWRMCFGMWVAAASFFWGPAERVPDIIRIPALLPIPVLLPIAVMLYWLWRLRAKRATRALDVNAAALGALVTAEGMTHRAR